MRKEKKPKAPMHMKRNKAALSRYNTVGYVNDVKHICELGLISESRRDWIETNMLRLRDCANKYEIDFGAYLIKRGVKFIHQAPFIFSGKIYFADFYLPDKHAIIELDGQYHEGMFQSEKDRFRDSCFNGHKLKVIRIPNAAVYREKELRILCDGLV